jgi:Holliday junction resolvase
MEPKSVKAKGKNFERKIAKAINEAFGTNSARRTPCSGALDSFPGDVCLLPEPIHDFTIECKNQERMNLWKWIAQAERESVGKTMALVFSRNRSDTYVCMRFDEWLRLLKEARSETLVLQQDN